MKYYIYQEVKHDSFYSLRRAFSGVLPESVPDERLALLGIQVVEEEDEKRPSIDFPEEDPERIRGVRLQELDRAFLDYRANAVIFTPFGFPIDAGDRALSDVNGLIVLFEDTSEKIHFMDATNTLQEIDFTQLKAIRRLIVANGARAYAKKWEFRGAIEQAKTSNEVMAVEFDFEPAHPVETSPESAQANKVA